MGRLRPFLKHALLLLVGVVSAMRPTQRLSARAFGASRTSARPQRRGAVAMPSLFVQAAVAPKSGAAAFCERLSKTVAGALSKPESYVLTSFSRVDALCFGGDATTPAAFLYLSSLGSIAPDRLEFDLLFYENGPWKGFCDVCHLSP